MVTFTDNNTLEGELHGRLRCCLVLRADSCLTPLAGIPSRRYPVVLASPPPPSLTPLLPAASGCPGGPGASDPYTPKQTRQRDESWRGAPRGADINYIMIDNIGKMLISMRK